VRRLTLWLACVVSLLAGSASAHDASSYGGVFRSRDLGTAWLNADVGLFLNAALVIAVDPRDSPHLLVGTDLGILSSHNGGRSWVPEARDVIIGAVCALAFSPDGELAICAAASGVVRRDRDAGRRDPGFRDPDAGAGRRVTFDLPRRRRADRRRGRLRRLAVVPAVPRQSHIQGWTILGCRGGSEKCRSQRHCRGSQ
jgi:hypothetical protein